MSWLAPTRDIVNPFITDFMNNNNSNNNNTKIIDFETLFPYFSLTDEERERLWRFNF